MSSALHRQRLDQVLREDVLRRFRVGALDLDLHVEAARTQDRRVDHVLAVGCADHDDVLESLDAVDLTEQLRHDGGLDVGGDTRPAGTEDRVHLVEEHDHRGALGRLLPGPLEDHPDVPLGLADELVQQLGALDVQEVGLGVLAVLSAGLGDLLRERVGDRLGDERLTATGRTVEQHTLRRPQRVLVEQVLVEERQLDGVTDLLDLPPEATDVVVVDVGHLFEDQILDLGLGDALERVAGLGVDEQGVARPQLPGRRIGVVRDDVGFGLGEDGCEGCGEPDDPLLVGVADHQRALAVVEDLAQTC